MITASIVTYNTAANDLNNLEKSFACVKKSFTLFIIDHSPTDRLREFYKNNEKVIYIHNPSNPGFGAGHNVALIEAGKLNSGYHFVINPDVFFKTDVISLMVEYMDKHSNIGMMMPQILNLDGSIQNLPKLLPSPLDVFMRKFKKPKGYYERFIKKYELRFVDSNVIYDAPILSGCFTLFRMTSLVEVGLYDDRFFMYFEDWDLSRRMNSRYRTVYYPRASIYHGYESGANRSSKLFKIFLKSAIYYFSKWGWFMDSNRTSVNSRTLSQF